MIITLSFNKENEEILMQQELIPSQVNKSWKQRQVLF